MQSKHRLFLFAAIFWMFAGFMVLITGITSFIKVHSILICIGFLITFIIFFKFIFLKLVRKHEMRILNNKQSHMKWWEFFDTRGYFVIIFMMSLGFLIRKSGAFPESFFAFFYTGLGLALFISGIAFISLFMKQIIRKKKS